jgi:nucleotide-binding universal stress UspA family protein
VVGSHGRIGVRRLMLGSVASKVVAESTVPVLVVR